MYTDGNKQSESSVPLLHALANTTELRACDNDSNDSLLQISMHDASAPGDGGINFHLTFVLFDEPQDS